MDGKAQFDNIMNGRTPDGSPRNSNSTNTTRSSSPFELMEDSMKAITTSDDSKVKGSSSEDHTGMTPDEIEDINKSINKHKDKLESDTASFKERIIQLKLTQKIKEKKVGGIEKEQERITKEREHKRREKTKNQREKPKKQREKLDNKINQREKQRENNKKQREKLDNKIIK